MNCLKKEQIPNFSGTLQMRSDRFKIYEKNPRLRLNTPEVEDEEAWGQSSEVNGL